MKLLRTIVTPLFFGLLAYPVKGQDIHFSQFAEAPLWRNPSLAGLFEGDIRVQTVYRDQWNNVTNAYRTGALNAVMKIPVGRMDDFLTAGLQVLQDRAGSIGFTTTQALPALSYHKSLSTTRLRYLSLGFMGGWVQRYFDISKVTTNTQFDGGGLGENFSTSRYNYVDASVGMHYHSDFSETSQNTFFVGAAYHHFHQPSPSFFQNGSGNILPKWVFSGGMHFNIGDNAYLTLQADHTRQGGFTETIAGGMYGMKLGSDPDNSRYTLHTGAFLRWNDALIPVIKLDFAPFSMAVSYDSNISLLKPNTYGRGGFEVSLSYQSFRRNR